MKKTRQLDSLVQPLVEHVMSTQNSLDHWQQELLDRQVLTKEDILASDEKAIRLAFKAMKTMEFSILPEDKLMAVIGAYQVGWNIELPEDLQQGAVCY